jgi:thimet oligopeptidase
MSLLLGLEQDTDQRRSILNSQKETDKHFGQEGDKLYATCQRHIAEIQQLRDQIVNTAGAHTKENTLMPVAEIEIHADASMSLSELLQSVHPDENVRNAAEACHQEMAKLISELALDRDLYTATSHFETQIPSEEPTDGRFIEHTLRDFRQSGVDKDDATRSRIKAIKEELVVLAQEFSRNIRDDTRSIEIDDPSHLQGLPQDYIDGHPQGEDGKIRITTDYPDLVPFMSYAKSAEHRRRLHFAYTNRAFPQNIEVLDKILARRHELANLLGHDSWASFISADKMIGSATAISEFVEKISAIAADRSISDYDTLLKRKQQDVANATTVEEYEKSYYAEMVRAETLGFDSQEIRPYLPFARVKEGVLSFTQKLFGIAYRRADHEAWHPAVETYDVFAGDDPVGRFYLDMHPREGKYKHAAMFPIVSGIKDVQLPEAAVVCNFPDPAEGPALLEHGDVVTLFHEFGHLLHHVIGGAAKYVRFSGVATEWDFVEVPSQLLEEWAYSYEILKTFAVNEETGESVPKALVKQMNKARSFGRGAGVRQQMFFAALSLTYHSQSPQGIDSTDLVKELQRRYSAFPYVEDTHFQASFGHLEGYSALYYTYMWSLVIARDLFDQFSGENLMNTDLAVRYRKNILEPGGSQDARDLVRAFLNRDYNLDAYQRWMAE